MGFIWIAVAFLLGLIARRLTLPPLVGYLAAGFVLNACGVEAFSGLEELADLGITLMLFTIGLKVNVRTLFKPEVAGTASLHLIFWVLLFAPGLLFVAAIGTAHWFDVSLEQAALIGFALSFSSTVCVIKILEDRAELKSSHSDLAISILIIQDLIAVLFLVVATGKTPNAWALILPLLLFARPLLTRFFAYIDHGELVPLLGFFLALGGSELFELANIKGDLGALAAGLLIAGLPRSSELYKSLISFKDLFLIGFFLSIGFVALPTWEMWLFSLALLLLLPLKGVLFFFIFISASYRARTAFLASLLLANFSEFGLIVASLGVDQGWLLREWLVVLALAIAQSFILSTLLYKFSFHAFARFQPLICRWQRERATLKHPFEQPKPCEVLIIGMGRVGSSAYREMEEVRQLRVAGVEVEQERAIRFREQGLNVIHGDADDIEFWEHIDLSGVQLMMLAIPSANEMASIIEQLKRIQFQGRIAAVAQYEDERAMLLSAGADVVFNYFAEVGTGFAEESIHLLS